MNNGLLEGKIISEPSFKKGKGNKMCAEFLIIESDGTQHACNAWSHLCDQDINALSENRTLNFYGFRGDNGAFIVKSFSSITNEIKGRTRGMKEQIILDEFRIKSTKNSKGMDTTRLPEVSQTTINERLRERFKEFKQFKTANGYILAESDSGMAWIPSRWCIVHNGTPYERLHLCFKFLGEAVVVSEFKKFTAKYGNFMNKANKEVYESKFLPWLINQAIEFSKHPVIVSP